MVVIREAEAIAVWSNEAERQGKYSSPSIFNSYQSIPCRNGRRPYPGIVVPKRSTPLSSLPPSPPLPSPPSDASVADISVMNTCSIREKAELKVYSALGDLAKVSKRNEPELYYYNF